MSDPSVQVLSNVELGILREVFVKYNHPLLDVEELTALGRMADDGSHSGELFTDYPSTERLVEELRAAGLTAQMELVDPVEPTGDAKQRDARCRVYSKPRRAFVTADEMMAISPPGQRLLEPTVVIVTRSAVCEGCVGEAIERTNELITQRRRVLALSYASHDVVAMCLGYRVTKLSILPQENQASGGWGYGFSVRPGTVDVAERLEQKERDDVVIRLAGAAAIIISKTEDRLLINQADRLIHAARQTAQRLGQADIADARTRAMNLWSQENAAIAALANAIVELGEVDGAEAESIFAAVRTRTLGVRYQAPWSWSYPDTTASETATTNDTPSPALTWERDPYFQKWNGIFSSEDYVMGADPGPIARRTVRYHRQVMADGGEALDLGCGEGQDLAFLAERGYQVTGIEFTPNGVNKTRRLLAEREVQGEVLLHDIRSLGTPITTLPGRQFDLLLIANTLQDLGADAATCLNRLRDSVRAGGVFGISNVGREPGDLPEGGGNQWRPTLAELESQFDGWEIKETSYVWQREPNAETFVTLIAHRPAAVGA